MRILKIFFFIGLISYLNAEITKQTESILKDTITNLLWQDTKDNNNEKKNFVDAQKYCENLELDGYKNWKLPDFLELFSIVDTKLYNPTLSKECKFFVSDGVGVSSGCGFVMPTVNEPWIQINPALPSA